MGFSRRSAVCLVVVGVGARANAFDPHEHKFIADRGASKAVKAMRENSSEFRLLWDGPGGAAGKKWVKIAEPADKVGEITKKDESLKQDESPQGDPAGATGNKLQKYGGTAGKGGQLTIGGGSGKQLKQDNSPPGQVAVWAGNDKSGEWFSFGDLVAIYGDLRVAVKCDENSASCDVAQCSINKKWPMCDKGESAVYAHMKVLTAETPKSRLGLNEDCLADPMCQVFLKDALLNKTHFANDAVNEYQKLHVEALRWMSIAAKNSDQRGLWRALHYEALALHSLTDLLSAGHILFNRSGAVEKVVQFDTSVVMVDVVLSTLSSGGLQGVGQGQLHNHFNEDGLTVRSLHDGDHKGWRAYGDNFLQKSLDAGGPQAAYLSSAVEWSVMTLLNAYVTFREKKGNPAAIDQLYKQLSLAPATFVALKLVPIMYRAPCFPTLPFSPCLDGEKYRWVPHYALVKQLTGTK